MLYKPNFCCHCGEKIERLTWSPFTSRRFCELCETEKKPYDLLPRAVVAVGILLGSFGLAGLVTDRSDTAAKKPKVEHLPAQKRGIISRVSNGRVAESAPSAVNAVQPTSPNTDNAQTVPVEEKLKQRAGEAKTSTEAAYYCNAMTKKGTPCTRRVKTKGRCWQHQGQPAIKPS